MNRYEYPVSQQGDFHTAEMLNLYASGIRVRARLLKAVRNRILAIVFSFFRASWKVDIS